MSGSNSNVPPAPTLAIAPLDGSANLTGKVLTDDPVLQVTGTAAAGEMSVEILRNGIEDGVVPVVSQTTFEGLVTDQRGPQTFTAVQANANGPSPPSNAVSVFQVHPAIGGVSTVDLSYGSFQDLLAQGYQLALSSTTTVQFLDGTYDVATGAFSQSAGGNTPTAPPGANTVNASGGDTINLSGSTLVNIIAGANVINASGGADTIFAGTGSTQTTVNQSGSATILFQGGNAPSAAVEIVAQGTGGATIVGGANNLLVYSNAGTGTGAVFLASNGNETLFDALSRSNDALWASFSGGSDLMFAGSGSDALVAGGGAQTLVGGSGTDTFYLINPSLVASITGTAEPPGHYTVFNAHPGDTIALTGYDSLYGAAGSHAAAASVSASLAGGGSTITLKDGSTISFMGSTQGVHVISS